MRKIDQSSLAYTLFIFIVLLMGCESDSITDDSIQINQISGIVQKGPYINGTSIMISELDRVLSPTGKNFNTQIIDNQGTFFIDNIKLSSQFAELQANGFYFNEILGSKSSAQLTLYALGDIYDTSSVNINLLSNLEKDRVKYLLSMGSSFSDAKIQAQKEVLKIFSLSTPNIRPSEYLDITQSGDDNGILLAISVILQGFRTTSELSEIIARISSDIKEDGTLNSASIGSVLINDAMFLDTKSIRTNLENRYAELGISVEIPDFEKHVDRFIDSTSFMFTNNITYPDSGRTGPNLLSLNQEIYKGLPYPSDSYNNSITAIVPAQNDILIKIHFDQDYNGGIDALESGWEVDFEMSETKTYIFQKDFTKDTLDLKLRIHDSGNAIIEFFENNSNEPSKVKSISWHSVDDSIQ